MIIVDTRENENQFIIDYFEKNGIEYERKKLDFGDYKLVGNDDVVVERKAHILELSGNICSKDHERIKREFERCIANETKMYVVVADEKIKSLDELSKWKSPTNTYGRRYTKVFGTTLQKALKTIKERYGIEFVFLPKEQVAEKIVEILETHRKSDENKMYIKDGYLYFTYDKCKKITGTKFASIVDLNPYVLKGDQMLEILGLLPKEEIDPFLTKRGEIGEKIVKQLFESNGKETQIWDKEEVDYDNFPNEEIFGGLIDINLPNDNILIEVKSKPMSKKREIVKKGCIYQELQGKLYSMLKKSDLYMVWVFFSENAEKCIKKNKSFDIKGVDENGKPNCDFVIKQYKYDEFKDEMENLMEQARNYYFKVKKESRIALSDISEKVLERLKVENKVDIYE